MPYHCSGLPIGTGRMKSAFEVRMAWMVWMPKIFMKNVSTGAEIVTSSRRSLPLSWIGKTVTPAAPSV